MCSQHFNIFLDHIASHLNLLQLCLQSAEHLSLFYALNLRDDIVPQLVHLELQTPGDVLCHKHRQHIFTTVYTTLISALLTSLDRVRCQSSANSRHLGLERKPVHEKL